MVQRIDGPSTSDAIVGQLVDRVLLRGVEDVHLDGDYAFLPCREGRRLTICSITDSAHPRVVSSFTHPDLHEASGLAANGNTLYLTSLGNHQLLAIDVADKSHPRLVGAVTVGASEAKGVIYKVAYRDDYCYVAHQSEKKLFVVNVKDPSRPVVVGSVAVTTEDDGPFSVMLYGEFALIGTIFGRRNRLAVVDIRKPAAPRLVTQILDSSVGHVSGQIVGDLYYAVNWDVNAFLIFNIADPTDPRLETRLIDDRLGKPNRCIVVGNRAYLPMAQGDGVAMVDITDPRHSRLVAIFCDPVLKKTYGIASRGDLLYVGAREGNSLVVIDRSAMSPKPA